MPRISCSNCGVCFRAVHTLLYFPPPDAVRQCSASQSLLIFPPLPALQAFCAPHSVLRRPEAFCRGKKHKTFPGTAGNSCGLKLSPAERHTSDDKGHPRSGNPESRSPWTRPRRRRIRYFHAYQSISAVLRFFFPLPSVIPPPDQSLPVPPHAQNDEPSSRIARRTGGQHNNMAVFIHLRLLHRDL